MFYCMECFLCDIFFNASGWLLEHSCIIMTKLFIFNDFALVILKKKEHSRKFQMQLKSSLQTYAEFFTARFLLFLMKKFRNY